MAADQILTIVAQWKQYARQAGLDARITETIANTHRLKSVVATMISRF